MSLSGYTGDRRDWKRFDNDQGAPDPRDPDYSREGIFVYHNCWKCADGRKPCKYGNPSWCDYPHARDD